MNKMSMSFSQEVPHDLEILEDTFVGTFGILNSQEGPTLVPISNSDLCILSPSHESDTMPASTMEDLPIIYTEYKPISVRGPPERVNFLTNANFTVELTSVNAHKKKFLYSTKVERMYVQMNQNFSVSFNWDPTYTNTDMYVRATVVFSDSDQSEKRVERCMQHFHESSGLEHHIAKNVLHSTREIGHGTKGVYYCGDADIADSWLSTVVHFTKISITEACTHAYKFTCKNSCPTGINRRFISIIFQLEDMNGEVYGRDTLKVKVCSCPGRDMSKDEESEGLFKPGKKRVPSNRIPQTKTKKIKIEKDVEHNMVMLPQIPVEVNAMVSGLRTMVDMMTNAGQHDPDVVDKYADSITALKTCITNLEGGTPMTLPQ